MMCNCYFRAIIKGRYQNLKIAFVVKLSGLYTRCIILTGIYLHKVSISISDKDFLAKLRLKIAAK